MKGKKFRAARLLDLWAQLQTCVLSSLKQLCSRLSIPIEVSFLERCHRKWVSWSLPTGVLCAGYRCSVLGPLGPGLELPRTLSCHLWPQAVSSVQPQFSIQLLLSAPKSLKRWGGAGLDIYKGIYLLHLKKVYLWLWKILYPLWGQGWAEALGNILKCHCPPPSFYSCWR